MTDRDAVEKLIKNAYTARIAKDVDSVMKFFAPDATFQFAGSAAASPAAAHVRGAADLRATFSTLDCRIRLSRTKPAHQRYRG
jgi:ketosteroid isomerase-like protein